MWNSPTRLVYALVHFFVLAQTVGENLRFNQHIFKSGVALFVFFVLCHIGVDYFGARLYVARWRDKTVFKAEPHIILLSADYLTSHMPDAVDFRAVGEEVAVPRFREPPLSGVEGARIKARIVGADRFDVPLFERLKENFARLGESLDNEQPVVDALDVLRDFFSVVGALHQRSFAVEDVGHDEAI